MSLTGAITVDVDTLPALYKGRGCRRPGGYSYDDLHAGLENLHRFLEPYGVAATLFMVGSDFDPPRNHAVIREVARRGHEIANHTTTHAQGFRLLPAEDQESEIAGMEERCQAVVGMRPVGFRSPGWNIGDNAAQLLLRRGYLYDSSVFPTSMMPLLKVLHRVHTSGCTPAERTTLGHLSYMMAPVTPYRATRAHFGRPGTDGLLEFPITVVPMVRLPFFATFLVSTGWGLFDWSYRALRARRRPLQFQFHLSDFVDYTQGGLADEVPRDGSGYYVSKGLRLPLREKIDLFRRVMDTLVRDYRLVTLRNWAQQLNATT